MPDESINQKNISETPATPESEAASALIAIRAKLDELTLINKELENAKEQLETLSATLVSKKSLLENPENGLEATLAAAQKALTDGQARISEIEDAARKTAIKTETQEEEAKALVSSLRNLLTESEALKAKIADTLEMATGTGLSGSFAERASKLERESGWWRTGLIIVTIILVAVLLYIFYEQMKAPDGFSDWKEWYRFFYASPLVYLIHFFSRNHSRTQDALERYRFKAATANALNSYIALWAESFPDKDQLLEFVLTTMGEIFRVPYRTLDISKRFNFNIGWKVFTAKAEVDEHQANEVKPDEPAK